MQACAIVLIVLLATVGPIQGAPLLGDTPQQLPPFLSSLLSSIGGEIEAAGRGAANTRPDGPDKGTAPPRVATATTQSQQQAPPQPELELVLKARAWLEGALVRFLPVVFHCAAACACFGIKISTHPHAGHNSPI